MKSFLKVGIASLVLSANVTLAHGPGMHGQPAETPTSGANAMIPGTIKSVDKSAGKVTLQHDAVPSLKMRKSTDVFSVSNPSMLEKVRTGDKVRFAADKIGNLVTITAIESVK